MMPYIKPLSKTDFNLLAFDARHHGNSDEDDHSNMKKFAEDISAAINFIHEKTSITNHNIGVVGLSIGGAASIYAAAHDERIKSVITVGAFANPYDIMRVQLASRHIPYFPFGWFLFWYLEKKVGFNFKDIAPEKHISKSGAKFLLIHGKDDVTIPVDHLYRLKNAGNPGNVSIWEISGRGHSDCHYEVGYWEKIIQFLEDSLA
jgi:pimeloyl-ACP methyl ester carboxylesterase